MDQKDIIKRFFDEGLLISPNIISDINEDNIEETIKKAKTLGITTIQNLDFLKIKEKNNVDIKITEPQKKKKLTPRDFIDFYNKKYDTIKNMLLKKVDAVSINNAKKSFSNVEIIGMIKEVLPQGFVLEDPTGEVMVMSKESHLSEYDVIAVSGFLREGRIINGKVIYPDIPLNREISQIKLTVVFTTKINNFDTDYIFTRGSSEPTKNIIVLKRSPTWITLKKNKQKATIVYIDIPQETDPEEATIWLKKRYLPNNKIIDSNDNKFILNEIPNILWINSLSKWVKIYKGVMIISTTDKDSVKVDMENKKIEFINK